MVDATDRLRVDDCRAELSGLLQEEVSEWGEGQKQAHIPTLPSRLVSGFYKTLLVLSSYESQRLMGASLLVFANKMDVGGCMSEDDIREVYFFPSS